MENLYISQQAGKFITQLAKTKIEFFLKSAIILLMLLLFFCTKLFASPVDSILAQKVAIQHYLAYSKNSLKKMPFITLFTQKQATLLKNADLKEEASYYIFNVSDNGGFIIVSGDDCTFPVLGYTSEGNYQGEGNPGLDDLLKNYEAQIKNAKKNNIAATSEMKSMWNNYISTTKSMENLTSVGPLTTTTWNQSCYYNALCPPDASATGFCGHALTGCVATAMAQIICYNKYPNSGMSSNTYDSPYGTLSVDFSQSTYNYASMPNSINSSNPSIAKLIYDCGVSVKMTYGVGGSYAYGEDAQKALVHFFDYPEATRIFSSYYTDLEWQNIIKDNIDNGLPVLYSGWNSEGKQGHTFVVDGYDLSGGICLFYVNWGWGGYEDGKFILTNLVPESKFDFSYNSEAIVNIKPRTSDLTISTSSVTLTSPVNSTASIAVTSTNPWTAMSDQPWATVSPTSGSGNANVTINATTVNTSASPRVAVVTFYVNGAISKKANITQGGQTISSYLSVSSTNLSIGSKMNSSISFDVSSNVSWRISTPDNWLNVSPGSGNGMSTIVLTTLNANSTANPRNATLTISGNNVNNQIVVISQQANLGNGLTISPAYPTMNDNITITLDPRFACNKEGESSLVEAKDVYMYSGLTIDTLGNWQYLVSFDGIGKNGVAPKFTKNSNGTYSFTYRPADFYNVPANDNVSQIGMVFNNGSWTAASRDFDTNGCKDYFIPIKPSIANTHTVSTKDITLGSNSNSSNSFQINSNTSWTVKTTENWINISPSNGTNNGSITITSINANTSQANRTAIITVEGSGVTSQSVTVTQTPVTWNGITFSPEKPTVTDLITITLDPHNSCNTQYENSLVDASNIYICILASLLMALAPGSI